MINETITAAESAISSNDHALIDWARRNVECALEELGDTLRFWHRRTHSRFAMAKAEAIDWEAENRQAALSDIDKLAGMLDRIDNI